MYNHQLTTDTGTSYLDLCNHTKHNRLHRKNDSIYRLSNLFQWLSTGNYFLLSFASVFYCNLCCCLSGPFGLHKHCYFGFRLTMRVFFSKLCLCLYLLIYICSTRKNYNLDVECFMEDCRQYYYITQLTGYLTRYLSETITLFHF